MNFSGISLVTGAAGFMGSHVVETLVREGIKVRATSRPRADISFFKNLGVEYVAADLTKPETLPPLFERDVDRVFHLGAICNFSTPYEKLHPTNVLGVDHITRAAMENNVKCFVHVTSTSVYGYYKGSPFSEDDDRDPMDNYGRSKRDGENIVFKKMSKGLPAIIVRPCTVYGPRCNDGAGKVFSRPTAITAIPGNGTQKLSNIRAEDVADAILYLSTIDDAAGKTFNMSDNSNPSLKEALTLAAETFRSKSPKLHLPLAIVKIVARMDGWISGMKGKIPDLEYDATKYLYNDYLVDNSRLKSTGFQFKYPDFTKSMKQIEKWYWSQPESN
ncbi:MAG: NAD-dependent epimerase/dehydratase family protein [Desulfobacteraceae bacterium]|nr:NAD-dependent epimerase/dehydratase family protein [Desulfobacteraceae bacterium]MBC2757271.1 NAD-dependent epimerase/dehydratase family protein [Desulfobacteraceae bacterium]